MKKYYFHFVFALSIILRIIFGIKAKLNVFQHDVMREFGHFEYAKYIFENAALPLTNNDQFYHPPLNAIFQAIFVKILSIFSNDSFYNLYMNCKYLAICYSIITIIIIYFILKELINDTKKRNLIFILISLHPSFILLSNQYNNDSISIMFFFLSIYLVIKWCKSKIIFLSFLMAISIGLAMLCKLSNSIIAFIAGPMLLIILVKAIKNKIDSRNSMEVKLVLYSAIIFIIIVFPLGLSYAIRNLILFEQPINYVYEVAKNTKLDVSSISVFERVFTFPILRFFNTKDGIFHSLTEYNIWVDLIKTSVFDEINNIHSKNINYFASFVMLISNIIFVIFSVLSFIFVIIKKNKIILNSEIYKISSIMFFIGILSYIIFNIKYPYSCTSSYRYIVYIFFSLSVFLGYFLDFYKCKFYYFLYGIFVIFTSVFFITLNY